MSGILFRRPRSPTQWYYCLFDNFASEVQIPEARAFYSFQEAIESIHNEVYNLLIETLIKDPEKKKKLFYKTS